MRRREKGLPVVDQLLAIVAASLEADPEAVWMLVALLPASELRVAVRLLAEEVADRMVAPAEDREVALARLRARLLTAAEGQVE